MTKTGMLIRTTRLKKHITQTALAKTIGCHNQQLSNIEKGLVNCPLHLGKQIAFELGIPATKMKKALAEDLIERKWNGTKSYTEHT